MLFESLPETDDIETNKKSPRNKTIELCQDERIDLKERLICSAPYNLDRILNKIIFGDTTSIIPRLPKNFVDLLIIDPPYNLSKTYSDSTFKKIGNSEYEEWLDGWIKLLPPLLKPNSAVYICCDWSSSPHVYNVASKYFNVVNRITWEREKGRGAQANWKNCSEDIWYFSNGKPKTFNLNDVKLKRRVVAPYKNNGKPKGWEKTQDGNFRFTSPSNLWTDVTVPFWSMPENTNHPTQKPEKLIAKLILASSHEDDVVFDPFLGSGTTLVVAHKLGRKFLGIEIEEEYCMLAQKRVLMSEHNKEIQGYEDGVFLERNTMQLHYNQAKSKNNAV
jgi:site-specific DNA-methyltransferase (adenine-specific)